MNLDELYFKDNFTKEENKTNLSINRLEAECITSKNNKFSLDENGNLTVNSINTNNNSNNELYPIGSIYMSVNNVNPSTLFGGSWERWGIGRIPIGIDENNQNMNSPEKTGGKSEIRLSAAIGACNNNASSIGYIAEEPNNYQNNKNATYIINSGNVEFAHWNHSTPVTEMSNNSRNVNILPPFITCYMWKRVG